MSRPSALVCGAGGFIGSHLVRRLKSEGFWVRGVDLKCPEFSETEADDFVVGDLRDRQLLRDILDRRFDEVYQLAADMGGAGYIFTGEHDADVMHNSASINLNMLRRMRRSAEQADLLFLVGLHVPGVQSARSRQSELRRGIGLSGRPGQRIRLGEAVQRATLPRLSAQSRHSESASRATTTFSAPRAPGTAASEKAPAAVCRKVAMAPDGGEIEIWGDGKQTRSFLYVDECLDGTLRLMRSDFTGPVNIGSDEMVTINQLVDIVADIAGKRIIKRHVDGPTGVRGRNSDNRLIKEKLGWAPSKPLRAGLEETYVWIEQQTRRVQEVAA